MRDSHRRYPPVNVYITNWKDPPCLMGKLTISMAMFNSFLYVYQRVSMSWSQDPPFPKHSPRDNPLLRLQLGLRKKWPDPSDRWNTKGRWGPWVRDEKTLGEWGFNHDFWEFTIIYRDLTIIFKDLTMFYIPLEIRPERLGLPKCRVPSLPPYKMVWGHLQNGSTHGGCCLQNGGPRVPHLPTNIKYFGLP